MAVVKLNDVERSELLAPLMDKGEIITEYNFRFAN